MTRCQNYQAKVLHKGCAITVDPVQSKVGWPGSPQDGEIPGCARVAPHKGHQQRIVSSHIPPCHRHMVIATIVGSLFCLAALQHKPNQSRMLP